VHWTARRTCRVVQHASVEIKSRLTACSIHGPLAGLESQDRGGLVGCAIEGTMAELARPNQSARVLRHVSNLTRLPACQE